MALFWPGVKRFIRRMEKVRSDYGLQALDEEAVEDVPDNTFSEVQYHVINGMCELGRHDYEFKKLIKGGVEVECSWCGETREFKEAT